MAKRGVVSPPAGSGQSSDLASAVERAAEEVNEATSFDVALQPVAKPQGTQYWRVVKVRRLTPDENRGRHNIYVRAIDETGKRVRDERLRVRWTWQGRTPDQEARPPALDKGDADFGHADIPLEKGVHAEIWLEGDGLESDHVANLHTDHNISEKTADGSDGNTWFHHSFLVVFQRLPVKAAAAPKAPEKPAPPPKPPKQKEPTPAKPPKPEPQPAARRGNRLGFYLQSTDNGNGLWDAIATVQPPVMVLHHDAVNDILLNETRSFRAPNTFVVGRWYLTNDEQRAMLEAGDPEGQGHALAERILNHDFQKFRKRTADGRLYIDAWMSLNECLPGPASSSYRENSARWHALYGAYDLFQAAFRKQLAQEKIEAVAFNFAAGNFTDAATLLEFFPQTLATYTWLGFHEYGWPALNPAKGALQAGSSGGSYRKIMQGIQATFGARHRVIMTEAGVTRAYGTNFRDEGWLNGEQPLSEGEYWESLQWYNEHLNADAYVLGAALFQVGHGGDWATFRHLGKDNQGKPIGLMARIRSLREMGGEREAPPLNTQIAAPRVTLKGVVTHKGKPVRGAFVRLIGSETQMGGVRGAVVDSPGAYNWTQRVTDFGGTLYQAWVEFVADEVAGISKSGFETGMRAHYGNLERLDARASYLLPQTASHPEITWDHAITGYGGTLRSLWLDWLRGKVVGLDYRGFKRLAPLYNPSLSKHKGALDPAHTYLLPRAQGATTYALEAITGRAGRFRFDALPAGDYAIEVRLEGYRTLRRAITLPADDAIMLALELVVDPEIDFESAGQGAFVGVVGNEFVVNGQVLRFIGVNLRGLVYYGAGKPNELQHSTPAHRHEILGIARDMRVRVVRVFLPCTDWSTERTIQLLGEALEIAGANGMYVIPAMVDFYSTTPFRIPGDDGFYEQLDPNFHPKLLNGAFYRGGYRERYLPFIQAVVSAFRDDARIFAWEVGNELKYEPAWADPERAVFINFMQSVARAIRQIDPNHLVTTGMISTSHASLNEGDLWRRLYGSDDFDFLTVHCYNEQYEGKVDWDYARALNKPFIVEEAGFGKEKPGDRVDQIRRDMEYWFGRGARGYMQWGFMPIFGDIGDGDDDSGMDRKFHGDDFDGLFALYRQRADALAAESAAAPRPTPSRPAPVPAPTPTPAPIPEPTPLPATLPTFSVGQTVFALTPLRVRQTPGFVGKAESDTVVVLNPGQALAVVSGPVDQDALRWWQVSTGGQSGWAAQANGDTLLLGVDAPAFEMIEGMELEGMEVQG